MHRFFLCFFFLLIFSQLKVEAAVADTALISRFDFEFRGSEELLPNYFKDEDLRQAILNEISDFIRQEYKAQTVLFDQSNEKVSSRNYHISDNESAESAAMHFQFTGNLKLLITSKKGETFHHLYLSLKGKGRNHKNRRIFRNKISTKALIEPCEGIYTPELISKKDFKFFFTHSLERLFEKAPDKELRFRRPAQNHFQTFTQRAKHLEFSELSKKGFFRSLNEYEFFNSKAERNEKVTLELGKQTKMGKSIYLFQRDSHERKYHLKNELEDKEYSLSYALLPSDTVLKRSESGNYYIRFEQDASTSGTFQMNTDKHAPKFPEENYRKGDATLSGKWRGKTYDIWHREQEQLTAIYHDHQLIALVQQSLKSKFHRRRTNLFNLYIQSSPQAKQQAALVMNLWLAFKVARLGEIRQTGYGN
jgi:hypothetical protein